MRIVEDDLSGAKIAELLALHIASAHVHSPPESVHAMDIAALRAPQVTFWTAWDDDALLGCGALKSLGADQGEIKSMRTAPGHLRKGVAAAILAHILAEARSRGYARISLETGTMAAFAPARALYARFGFVACAPFARYFDDPLSQCMTRAL